MSKKVSVYIDGFNLFYGALKKEDRVKYRWLNPKKLIENVCSRYFEKHNCAIQKINFYTARVSKRNETDDSAKNQQIYFNALNSIKELEIHLGNFISKPVFMAKFPITDPVEKCRVMKTEEKGSDVNLASHLVFDACQDKFDVAVVITNDTDLYEPIKIANELMGKPVILISPYPKMAYSLQKTKTLKLKIETQHLKASLFDDVAGKTNKPNCWK